MMQQGMRGLLPDEATGVNAAATKPLLDPFALPSRRKWCSRSVVGGWLQLGKY